MDSSHSEPGEPCKQDLHLPDLYEASITELQRGLSLGHFTTVDLVKAYLARIEEVNHNGPNLRAVLETNPKALAQAAVADDERKGRPTDALGLLHGIPIIVKDNMATSHEEGSYALLGSVVPRDATVVSYLRGAGAIILGKSNLSEWSNFRGVVPSGFSGRGGQGTSPYYPLLNPSGSSSGSAVAVAIGLAAGALGTETDGSIVSPAGANNIVGLKPTVGLTSRAGVIPISSHQDSVGPMARTVEDVAVLLSVIAGRDELDPATMNQPQPVPDYRKALDASALRGARFGVPRKFQSHDEPVDAAFDQAIELIRAQGGIVVDPADFSTAEEILESRNEAIVLDTDFKIDINKYLSELKEVPTGVKTLADLINFNNAHADQELIPPFYADQSQFIAADATVVDEKYHAALAANADLGRARGIDATLKKYHLDAFLLPIAGYHAATPSAIAGYPLISVPLGFQPEDIVPTEADPTIQNAPGAPFGISFAGTAFSEFKLISLAFAYEQATRARLGRRAYEAAIPKIQLADVIAERRG
ncbi:amidase signature enzyme [Athelia psychrophila]|uniref:Amidase signature enzyme n=1 Tax=Athelia psychrophila TaxID=1759441 RepID=A0A166G134_9AGAM|nr:amidase signature enzyme [Fibularhizoctonia sp. CBS 109695]